MDKKFQDYLAIESLHSMNLAITRLFYRKVRILLTYMKSFTETGGSIIGANKALSWQRERAMKERKTGRRSGQ